MSQITEGKIMQTMISNELQQGDNISITITDTYYKKLLFNAWAVERLKKHLQTTDDREFKQRAESILMGTLKDKMDIKDFGKE